MINAEIEKTELIDSLTKAVNRVRELHASVLVVDYHKDEVCQECSVLSLPLVVPYPCPTIKALDGEQ